MTNEHNIISIKLRQLRKLKNMTQAKLAKKVGLYETAIAKMEAGAREITAIELAKIARILNVNMNAFVHRSPVFDGGVEESIVEALGLLPDSKKKRVIDILKADLYVKVRKSKGENRKRYKELMQSLGVWEFER